ELLDQPRTPLKTLRKARDIGLKTGLKYVYEGNVPGEGGENTYCPDCGGLNIKRNGFYIKENKIISAHCYKCNTRIEGIF
ncbi:MAG: radical SAM protein, partial [Candidatus Mariimomonas ferrooxydans]